jgi:hypothetical protein
VLINDGAGHFVDETAARFPVTTDSSRGGGLSDVDDDGDLDLLVGKQPQRGGRVLQERRLWSLPDRDLRPHSRHR